MQLALIYLGLSLFPLNTTTEVASTDLALSIESQWPHLWKIYQVKIYFSFKVGEPWFSIV